MRRNDKFSAVKIQTGQMNIDEFLYRIQTERTCVHMLLFEAFSCSSTDLAPTTPPPTLLFACVMFTCVTLLKCLYVGSSLKFPSM